MNPDPDERAHASENPSAEAAINEDYWRTTALPLLEQIAERHLRGEREATTLEPADLVQEAYLRLSAVSMPIVDRRHFVSMVSTTMRRVLVDHARRKQAAKRGAHPVRMTLQSSEGDGLDARAVQLLELDCLLNDLARADPRKARLIDMHYFGGLTRAEMTDLTGLSPATLGRELSFARSWILAQIGTVQ